MNRLLGCLAATALVSLACSTDVPRTNPFDPDGTGPKAPGRITGEVFVQGLDSVGGLVITVFDVEDVEAAVLAVADDGTFLTEEINAGLYRLQVDVPVGNVPIVEDGIEVLPGQTTDVGLLISLVEPPTGIIIGTVSLEQTTESVAGTRVIASRTVSGTTQTWDTVTDGDGNYFFNELPPGGFELIADREGFTPDRTAVDLASPSRAQVTAAEMKLYPASAVIRFSVTTGMGEVLGAPFTQSNGGDPVPDGSVNLVMLAFGGVNEMRFSERSDFTDAVGMPVAWRDYVAQVPVRLTGPEGLATMYGQFRVMEDVAGTGVEKLRTEVYETTIIYDATPPSPISVVLAPDALERSGVRYLTTDPTSTPVEILAVDPHSLIDGIKIAVEGEDPTMVPFDALITTGPNVTYLTTVSLSAGDGLKDVEVYLRDGAGNVSAPIRRDVTIDSTPPVLLQNPAIVVRGVSGSEINSTTVTLQFLVGEDSMAGIDGPVRMRFGLAPAPPTGATLPFFPEATLLVNATHGQVVSFYGVFEDNAGNAVVATSMNYTLNLQGTVSGRILLEGVPESQLSHDGTLVSIYPAGVDYTTTPAVGSVATLADGNYSVSDIPVGTYQVVFTRAGAVDLVRSPAVVSAGSTTEMGLDRLVLARGNLQGIFHYADAGMGGNHGGITVTAILNSLPVASAVTDDTGAWSMAGVAVAPNYTIRGSATGYVSVDTVTAVLEDQTVAVNDDGMGSPLPIDLPKLAGDFKICDKDDMAMPPKDCVAILYTNETSVLLGLDAQNVTDVRFIQQDPLNPGAASFSQPTEPPGGSNECAAAMSPLSEEDCWHPYSDSNQYLVTIDNHGEARVTVLVQFANNSVMPADVRPVSSSQIVFDQTAPLTPSIDISRGATALIDGHTNDTELSLNLTAVATLGLSTDAAPISSVRVSRDANWDGNGTMGDQEYSYGGIKLFDVAAGDGTKDVYAWFCDAASNCNTMSVTDSIILDQSYPTQTNGRDIRPAGPGVTGKAIGAREWWTRSATYSAEVDVGTSPWGIAEVAAYRISSSIDFVGAEWILLDLGTVSAGVTLSVAAPALPAADGEHVVYSQFQDAAGNLSTPEIALDQFSLFLDTIPPGGTVTIEGGADYTRNTTVAVALTTDDATDIQTSWTGVLPHPYNDPTAAYMPALMETPGGGDGFKTLLVRMFDEAGNFSERSDSVFIDTTPPYDTARAACDSCTTDSMGLFYYNDALGEVTLEMFAIDNSGIIDHVDLLLDSGLPGETTITIQYAPFNTFTLSTVEASHNVEATFYDPAGNSRTVTPFDATYDITPPMVTVTLDSAANWTNDTFVDIDIVATDSNPLEGMFVSNSATFGDAFLRSYATSVSSWEVDNPGTDGEKRVYVRVLDAAGNPASDDDTIQLDATAPTLTVTLTGSAAAGASTLLTNDPDVDIDLVAVDPGGGLASGLFEMRYANDPASLAAAMWMSYGATIMSHTLGTPTVSGTKTVYVEVSDSAGNIVSGQASIELDLEGPALGSVTFTEGGVVSTTSATLSLVYTEAAEMRLAGVTSPAPATWMAVAPLTGVTLPAGNGMKTVTVELRDAAGNLSTPASRNAVIVLDVAGTGDPTDGTVTVTGTDRLGPSIVNTSTAQVSVALASFADNAGGSGLTHYAISESAVFSGAPWVPCPTDCNVTVPFTLSPGDAPKTVYAKVKDAAGNESSGASSNAITLDTTAPTLSVILEGTVEGTTTSNTHTRLRAITVMPTASDGGSGVSPVTGLLQVSDDPSFSAATWVNLGDTAHTLPDLDGSRRVYAKVRDLAGNETVADAAIILDQEGPALGSVTFTEGAVVTSTSATLSVVQNGASEMRLTGVTTPPPATWMPVAPLTGVTLPSGNGAKTVIVELRDVAGNLSVPASRSAVITLDAAGTGDPTDGTVVVTGTDKDGASTAQTRLAQVSVALSGFADNAGGSGLTDYALSESAVFSGAPWIPCGASCNVTVPFSLSPGDGPKTVYARVRDAAGNESSGASSNAIELDTTPPAVSVVLEGTVAGAGTSNTYTRLRDITVQPNATDSGSGLSPVTDLLQVSDEPTFATAMWENLGNTGHTLPDNDGDRRVWIKVRDLAGNAAVADAEIMLDRVGPVGESVIIDDNAQYTDSTTGHDLDLSAIDALSGVDEMRIGTAPGAGSWVPFTATQSNVSLAAGAGNRRIYATFRDRAGNESAETADTITVDLAAPTSVSFSADGYTGSCSPATENWVTSSAVRLGLNASDDIGVKEFKIAEDGDFGAAPWIEWSPDYVFNLSSGDGEKTISYKVRDHVDRETTAADVCVTLDTTPPINPDLTFYSDSSCANPVDNARFNSVFFYMKAEAEDEATNGSVLNFRIDNNLDVNNIYSYADGITYHDSQTVSAYHYYNSSSNMMPYQNCVRGRFEASSATTERLWVYFRDEAGNWSSRIGRDVYYDDDDPTVPILGYVESRNRGAGVFWSASDDATGPLNSGIDHYKVYYSTNSSVTTSDPSVMVDGMTLDVALTGLNNRRNYWFGVSAVDGAGNESAISVNRPKAAIGYKVQRVLASEDVVIPVDVLANDGSIFISYLRLRGGGWDGSSMSGARSTVHVARSTDGGQTWTFNTVDGTENEGRSGAQLAVYRGSIYLVTIGDAFLGDNDEFRVYVSDDNGDTWAVEKNWTDQGRADDGLALVRDGGGLTAYYTFYNGSNDDLYTVSKFKYNDGSDWQEWGPHNLLSGIYFGTRYRACANGADHHLVVQYGTNDIRWLSSYSHGDTYQFQQPFTGQVADIACNDNEPGSAYMIYRNNQYLYLRWTDIDRSTSYSSYTLRSNIVDPQSVPAVWAAGRKDGTRLFVAYRHNSTGAIYIGDSETPNSGWTWVAVDESGLGGLNMVMTGWGDENPVLAYGDIDGLSINLVTVDTPAPDSRPSAVVDLSAMSWNMVTNSPTYEVRYGTSLADMDGGSATVTRTPATFFTWPTAGDEPYATVSSVDPYGQTGPRGSAYQISGFTESTVTTGTGTAGTRDHNEDSSTSLQQNGSPVSDMVVNGSTVVLTLPPGFNHNGTASENDDIDVWRSTNSGASFSKVTVANVTDSDFPAYRYHSLTRGSGSYMHLFTTWSNGPPSTYLYRYRSTNDGANWVGAYAVMTTANRAVWSVDSKAAGGATTQKVVVAYVVKDSSVSPAGWSVRMRCSYNGGGTWEAERTVYNYGSVSSIYGPPSTVSVAHVEDDTAANCATTDVTIAWVAHHILTDPFAPNLCYRRSTNGGATFSSLNCKMASSPGQTDSMVLVPQVVASRRDEGDVYNQELVFAYQTTDLLNVAVPVTVATSGYHAVSTATAYELFPTVIDLEQSVPGTLAMVHNADGIYLAYTTNFNGFGLNKQSLKLAYCPGNCQGPGNWSVRTLKTVQNPASSDLTSPVLAVDDASGRIYVGYQEQTGGVGFRMLSGGIIRKVR